MTLKFILAFLLFVPHLSYALHCKVPFRPFYGEIKRTIREREPKQSIYLGPHRPVIAVGKGKKKIELKFGEKIAAAEMAETYLDSTGRYVIRVAPTMLGERVNLTPVYEALLTEFYHSKGIPTSKILAGPQPRAILGEHYVVIVREYREGVTLEEARRIGMGHLPRTVRELRKRIRELHESGEFRDWLHQKVRVSTLDLLEEQFGTHIESGRVRHNGLIYTLEEGWILNHP